MHGSPYHVYPTNNYPAVQAFQGPAVYNMSSSSTASPMLATKFQQQQMVIVFGSPFLYILVFFWEIFCLSFITIYFSLSPNKTKPKEMSPILRNHNGAAAATAVSGSPHTSRMISQIAKQQMQLQQQQQQQQETSFITAIETDATVYKINAMFPTASESHIRLLLKK